MDDVRELRAGGATIEQAADALGRSRATIRTWCAAESFGGRRRRSLHAAPVAGMTRDLRRAIAEARDEIAAGSAPPFKPSTW